MIGACINKIEIFLPERILDNAQLEREYVDSSAEKIENKTGIRERHLATENQTALDMAYESAKRLLETTDPSKIDFLVLCTQSPDYYLPANACILQDRLGLSKSIGALDFNLGCSGYIYGLAMSKGLIQSRIASNILFITSETYSKHIHALDRSNRTIFGDGAAATLISSSKENGIGEFIFGTDGSGYKNLIVPTGGLKKRYNPESEQYEDFSGSIRTENNLYMNGPEIFNFTIDAVPEAVRQCVEKNQTTMDDVDYIIFHQANKYMLNHLRKKMNIPQEKYYMNLLHIGNTVSATIPIALKDSIDRDLIQRGNRVLLVGFGVGYSWGAVICRV